MTEDIVAIIGGVTLVAIPLVAISARIALKPIAEAIAHLRGQPDQNAERALQNRRLVDLEEEVDQLREEMRRLAEAQRFQERLESGPAPRAITGEVEG